MFGIAKKEAPRVERLPPSIENVLTELMSFGRVSMYQHHDGKWCCYAERGTTRARITIKSGNEHDTLFSAMNECLNIINSTQRLR